MRLCERFATSSGPWATLTRDEQLHQTRQWREPGWMNAAGVVVFKRSDRLLDTEVMTNVNLTPETSGAKQIHFGGFLHPRKDFLGPEFATLREMWEETGLSPENMKLEDLSALPEVVTLNAPTVGAVWLSGDVLHLTNHASGKNAYPHPHTITIFATDAPFEKTGTPDGEVTEVKWGNVGDIIERYGSDPSFCYPGVLFGLLWWLKTGSRFRYCNWPGKEFEFRL